MARPKKTCDQAELHRLASIGCRQEEIAALLDISQATVSDKYAEVYNKGRALYISRIRQAQFDLAMKGNATMLRWLGQNELGQRDMVEVKNENTQPIVVHWQDTTSPNNPTPVTSQPTTISAEVKETP